MIYLCRCRKTKTPFSKLLTIFLMLFFLINSLHSFASNELSIETESLEDYDGEVYPLDEICPQENAKGNFSKKVKVWVKNHNSEDVLQEFDLSEYSLRGLKSNIIEDTIINYEVIIKEDHLNKDLELPIININHKNKGMSLNFCRPEGGYQKKSLENVALSTLTKINKAYKFYKTSINQKQLSKLTLNIHPKTRHIIVEDYYNQMKMDSVDDVAWTSEGNNIFNLPTSILIYPSTNNNSMNTKEWEKPITLLHEFGHHIFYNHAKKLTQNIYKNENSDATRRLIFGANEAFADMFAQYAFLSKNDNDLNLLANVIESDRNININKISDLFKSDEIKGYSYNKIFSSNLINIITQEKNITDSCYIFEGIPSKQLLMRLIQDEHNIGAVIGFTFNQILNIKFNNTIRDLQKLKSESLIDWLEKWELKYNDDLSILSSGHITLDEMLKSFIDLHGSDESKSEIINSFFPHYNNLWL